MLKEIKLSETNLVHIGGRSTGNKEPAILLWGGSFIELTIKASELWIELAGPYTNHENWIAIEIEGTLLSRQMIPMEKTWIPVFLHRNSEKPTRIRIFKEVQAMSGDPHHAIYAYGIKTDGSLLSPHTYAKRIEFIGDSITSGEGTIGAQSEEDWISMFFSHTHSYSYYLGKMMDAEIRCISQSGWGLFASWDCHFDCNLPSHYEEICSLCIGEEFKEFFKPYDFSSFPTDAVIINLGTNDASAFHQPGYFNEATGILEELRMENDTFLREDVEKILSAMVSFLKKVRKNNPNAYILWAYGMLGYEFEEVIKEGIIKYQKETKDERISYLRLEEAKEASVGARSHPGELCHKQAAKDIAEFLQKVL